ncbi:MAG: hypothetical protein WC763_07090 [Candidatus Paceibacterota bacterium]|jgi:hypothetical protein
MRSAEIKNLSIALEALSRIPGTTPEALSMRIHDLLEDILTEEETKTKPKSSKTTEDDEIPF